MNKSEELIKAICSFDFKGQDNESLINLNALVSRAVLENRPINLILFTCSTINPAMMFSDKPWLYVRTNTDNNNLTPDISRLEEAIGVLKKIYPKINLKIIIGNTDPYYIYLQQFKDYTLKEKILWREFIKRWKKYRENFIDWVRLAAPSLEVEVISWYEYEKKIESRSGRLFIDDYLDLKNNLNQYFTPGQLDWEFKRLQTQFNPDTYFYGLRQPGDDILRDWVKRKFSEYAIQGLWLYENIENPVLIQNEKPSDLRSQMYQPAIINKYQNQLPVVYFFGADNLGYQ